RHQPSFFWIIASRALEHVTPLLQIEVPFHGFPEHMRRLAAFITRCVEVLVQRITVGRVHAVVDDHSRTLAWCQTTQIRKTLLGYQNLNVVLGVVDVRDHRYNARDAAALSNRLRYEDSHVGVTGKIARTAYAIHHLGPADMGRVDVAVNIKL